MKNNNPKDLSSFEANLFKQLKEASDKTPFSSERELEHFFGPSESIDDLLSEKLLSAMEETHKRRIELEWKLEDYSRIRSFGELIRVYCEYNHIPLNNLANCLALSIEEFKEYIKDQRPPNTLGIQNILTIIAFVGISIQEMLKILDRTMRLLKIKNETSISFSHARFNKDIGETTRHDMINDAMKELLLATDKKEEKSDQSTEWEIFKNRLLDEAKSDLSLSHIGSSNCYFIDNRQTRSALKSLLELTEGKQKDGRK